MMINPALLLMAAIGYIVGCFPTALVLLRIRHGKDVRKEGTGNVGAMNAYEVTGSRLTGILTFLIDAAKGVAAVSIARALHGDWFAAAAFAGVGVVIGHNYNALLKGKGGRGLATATGVFLVISPMVFVTWWITYLIGFYVIRKHVHVGNITGTIATGAIYWSIPNKVIEISTLVPLNDPTQMRYMVTAVVILIFMRHLEPMRELLASGELDDSD